MVRQLLFSLSLIVTLGVFGFTIRQIISYLRLTRPAFRISDHSRRLKRVMTVAIGQTRIFRRPVTGLIHALVFWGFCVIALGSIEMVIDGVSGSERSLKFLGPVYSLITASGDIFGLLVGISVLIFLFRRLFMHIARFEGIEMKPVSHRDANLALSMILLLMISLLGMNMAAVAGSKSYGEPLAGAYPVSSLLAPFFSGLPANRVAIIHEACWWTHILLIFIFANILPYSKHFHVFMSVPNVYLSRLDPLGKLPTMDNITREVKLMLDPSAVAPDDGSTPERFGVKDAEDISWKNYFDSLACTECGRCTSVCPANITGKRLSPRKIIMDVRARMKEKGPGLVRNGKEFSDGKSLLRDYITEEELWACTTCNACARECPVSINHPTLIIDMRRYLVMEEALAPGGIKSLFHNIENNGAPWQYPHEDRLIWAQDIEIPVMADLHARGDKPEYLFWVGCAGAFDDRYRKVSRAFARILAFLNTSYAVLGKEESCTGDPARRAGNEMLYQMQALHNIAIFEKYDIRKVVTICPHCYNIFRNEYPDLGARFEVISYVQFLDRCMTEGKLKLDPGALSGVSITYHDPCYLGRSNKIYDEPRRILRRLSNDVREMKRNRSFALCCGAGGGQMFKEAEPGSREVFIERTEEAVGSGARVVATACPFCMTMITDGIKYKNLEKEATNFDIAELIVQSLKIG